MQQKHYVATLTAIIKIYKIHANSMIVQIKAITAGIMKRNDRCSHEIRQIMTEIDAPHRMIRETETLPRAKVEQIIEAEETVMGQSTHLKTGELRQV